MTLTPIPPGPPPQMIARRSVSFGNIFAAFWMETRGEVSVFIITGLCPVTDKPDGIL